MTHKTPEELIHGLIDGELTADEQVRRAASGRAGRSATGHDDLRTLQTSLGSMPRHRAPVDLQAGVLAQFRQTRAPRRRSPRRPTSRPCSVFRAGCGRGSGRLPLWRLPW